MSSDAYEELTIQYAMARRQRLLASAEEIAELVLSRLGDEEKLVLASDAMLWNDDSSDRLDLARQTVLAYVRDIETDFEADPAPPTS
ncbi:MAG TPA: hypothetical protein VGM60_15335 [Pseudonocardia sp.]|jgi:hypothetical protein|uniref:hypothetical protein n=1 Tax=Pseudonocardia sp. TaxID=60912 RepID=UPI002F3F91E0